MEKLFKNLRLLATGAIMFISTMGTKAQTNPTYVVSTFISRTTALTTYGFQNTDIFGLDVDPNGNVYVVEAWGSTLSRITPGGILTMLNPASQGLYYDGALSSVHFDTPRGLYINPYDGNIYVTDTDRSDIRKITGFNFSSGTGGTSSTVQVYNGANWINPNVTKPYGISMTPNGDMYVADAEHHRIVVLPAGGGLEYVYAGSSTGTEYGTTNAQGASARFDHPVGLCSTIDQSGAVTLYVADYDNNKIRKIAPGAIVTDVNIGTGTLSHPRGIRIDCLGNLYVTDNNGINKIPSGGGSLTIIAGSASKTAGNADGNNNSALFAYPAGIWVNPAGNLFYVAEDASDINWGSGFIGDGTGTPSTNFIRKITVPTITTAAPSYSFTNPNIYSDCPTSVTAPVLSAFNTCPNKPSDVQSFQVKGDFLAGDLVITASPGFEVSLSSTTGYVGSTGSITYTTSTLNTANNVSAITIYVRMSATATPGTYSGVAVTCSSQYAVLKTLSLPNTPASTMATACPQIITQAYHVTTLAGAGTPGYQDPCTSTVTGSNFTYPAGVFIDNTSSLLVAEYSRIRSINTSSGAVSTWAGTGDIKLTNGVKSASAFNLPYNMCKDASGNFYIVEAGNHGIRKFDLTNNLISTFAGSVNGNSGSANGTGTSATFDTPTGICKGTDGNLYVADRVNHRIRKITVPGAVVTTFTGSTQGSTNGPIASALFNFPTGICVSTTSGDFYVTDAGNNKIRKITAAGTVSDFAGSTSGYTDGTGSAAKFSALTGITIDVSNNLYVIDGDRIRKINTTTAEVTTIAGSGTFDYLDGPGMEASFRNPQGLAVDPSGSPIYIADTKNNMVRKIALQNTSGSYKSATCPGTASAPQYFMVSGNNLPVSGTITVAASAGFGVCLTATGTFTTSLTLTAVGTSVSPTPVYVKILYNASTGTNISGSITCTTSYGTTQTISLIRTVSNPVFSIITTKDYAHNNGGLDATKNYPNQILSAKSDGLNTYVWSPATNIVANLNTSQSVIFNGVTTSNSAPTTYTVTATGLGGCTATQSVTATARKQGLDFTSYIDVGFISQGSINNPYTSPSLNNLGYVDDFNRLNFNPGGELSEDIFYKFILTEASSVVVSHCGSGIADSYITLFNEYHSVIAQNDNTLSGGCSNTNHAYIKRNLVPGTYYIASEGKGSSTGSITTNIQAFPMSTTDLVGYNLSNPIIISNNVGSCFSYTNTEHFGRGFGDIISGEGSNDIGYKMVLTSPQTVTLSTCNSKVIYPAIYLLNSSMAQIGMGDMNSSTSCSGQAALTMSLAAGTYYVVLETYYCLDYVTLNVSTSPGILPADPILISGNVGNCFNQTVTNTFGSCFRDIDGEDGAEVYYKFTTTGSPIVSLSACGTTSGQDVSLYFTDALSNVVYNTVFGSGCSSPATINNITLSPGTYGVRVGDLSMSGGSFSLTVTSATGSGCRLAEANTLMDQNISTDVKPFLSVYPNPGTGLINVNLNTDQTGMLLVTDMMGREVHKLDLQAGTGQYQTDLSGLPRGIYIMKVPGTNLSKVIDLQ